MKFHKRIEKVFFVISACSFMLAFYHIASAESLAFRTAKGQYIVAEGGGGGAVNADRVEVGPWEIFEVIDVGDGKVALKTDNGRYLVAEGGGGGAINADRVEIGPWEKFTIIPLRGNKICLKTSTGHFVVAEGGGGGAVNGNRDRCGEWETFEKIKQ